MQGVNTMNEMLKTIKKYHPLLLFSVIAIIYTVFFVKMASPTGMLPNTAGMVPSSGGIYEGGGGSIGVDMIGILCIFFWVKETSFFRRNLETIFKKIFAVFSVIALLAMGIYRFVLYYNLHDIPVLLVVLPAWLMVGMALTVYWPKNDTNDPLENDKIDHDDGAPL